jgi:FkbM family methyltransferase
MIKALSSLQTLWPACRRSLSRLRTVILRPWRSRCSVSELPKLNSRGKGTIGLVDVGSVGGMPQEWRPYACEIRFLLNFEPRESVIRTDTVFTSNTGLWSEQCERPFYIYKGLDGSGSSLYLQNYDYVRKNWNFLKQRGPQQLAETWFERSSLVRTEQVVLQRLDDVITEVAPLPFHFMKVDAQGAEFEVLRGADHFLRSSCIGLFLELFVLPLYKDIKLLPEVESFLSSRGFKLAKKFPAHGTFDSQHDCLFLKEGISSPASDLIRRIYDVE